MIVSNKLCTYKRTPYRGTHLRKSMLDFLSDCRVKLTPTVPVYISAAPHTSAGGAAPTTPGTATTRRSDKKPEVYI